MLMMGSCFRSRRFFPCRRIGEFFGVIIIFNRDPAYPDIYADGVIHGSAGEVMRRFVAAFRQNAPAG